MLIFTVLQMDRDWIQFSADSDGDALKCGLLSDRPELGLVRSIAAGKLYYFLLSGSIKTALALS